MSNFLSAMLGTLAGFSVVYGVLLVLVYVRKRRVNARVNKLLDDFLSARQTPQVNAPVPRGGNN